MFKHNRILILVDPDENNEIALDKAKHLVSGQPQVQVVLFTACYNGQLAANLTYDRTTLENAKQAFVRKNQEQLETLAAQLTKDNVAVEICCQWEKNLADAAIEYCHLNGVDLMVKSCHEHSFLQKTILSHTDWTLIRRSLVPVLFVKEKAWRNPIRVLSCIDPTHEEDAHNHLDERILGRAIKLNQRLNGQHRVLHVYDPTPLLMYLDQPAIDTQVVADQIKQSHQQRLDEFAARVNLPDTEFEMRSGNPVFMIADYVNDEGITITALGAVARGAIERMIIGNTAERLLDRLESDLLVIPASH